MITSPYEISQMKSLQSMDELSMQWQVLLKHAIGALETAYAPYSKFKVGAALTLENNEIIIGSNQENASYPLCMCAERVALYTSNVIHQGLKIKAIAVTALPITKNTNQIISPCGACRQVLFEKESLQQKDIPLLCGYAKGPFTIYPSIRSLLPYGFGPEALL